MPPQAVEEFQNALGELAAKSGEASDRLLSRIAVLSPGEARAFITDAYPSLLTPFLAASSDLTAQWYAEQPTTPRQPGAAEFVPVRPPLAGGEQLAISGRWALTQNDPVTALAGNATRQVMNASRDTVILNAARENIRWVRQAKLNACGFCKMLATRAAKSIERYGYSSDGVRLDKETGDYITVVVGRRDRGGSPLRGKRKLGSKYHDACRCIAVPVRDKNYEPPDYVQQWSDEYDAIVAREGTGDLLKISNLMDADRVRPDRPISISTVVTPATPPPVNLDQPVPDRVVLDEASTVEEVANYIRDKHGIDTTLLVNSPLAKGIPIEESLKRGADSISAYQASLPRVITVESAREFGQAVDDIMTKYPYLKLEEIKGDFLPYGDPLASAAHTVPKLDKDYKSVGHAESVVLNGLSDVVGAEGKSYAARSRFMLFEDSRYAFDSRDRPVYAVMVHEMGHVVDFNGRCLARNGRVQKALCEYIATLPGAPKLDPKRKFDLFTDFNDFEREWLRENLTSAYSFDDSDRTKGVFWAEALAEAFADVELRGEKAEVASKIIHREMVAAAEEIKLSKSK